MIPGLALAAVLGCVGPPASDRPAPDWVGTRQPLLEREPGNQQTTHVRRAPLGWGPPVELVVTETNPPRATWVGCDAAGCRSRPIPLGRGSVPARTATADLDGDGWMDLVVANLGQLDPTDARVGSVDVLWGGPEGLSARRVAQPMGRACCAEPGDLDGDGDLDLAVCAFGHEAVGMLGWLEQDGASWRQHVIDPRPGTLHAFPVDVDGDGDLDLLAAIAQLDEQVVLYRNDGIGGFLREILYDRDETWWGMSGIEPVDLDRDGDVDLLLTHGDTMDGDFPPDRSPSEVHGLDWLENDGAGGFTVHPILAIWGAYAVRAADLDGDGDLDLALGTLQTPPAFPDEPLQSLVLLINDGRQRFSRVDLDDAPPQIVGLEVADLDRDGQPDLAVGSLEFAPDSTTARLDAIFLQAPGSR